ncbi:DUF488 domain-containing protein [Asticcacaulis sp. BYS171W]|uniref:DUF488 domain-containing protein n=1 Tax=Asticcacaulis aquaticus TaxID=2984212 RepID=A0ABT5HUM9_9CAUL|nr:DUF488 domain-containing protein [Asticcacaulis aquaticus]MDC7683787.1 DUF488 domain-containing protein [Asticcacaulis aquaticus]
MNLFSIGHSNHEIGRFIDLLKQADVTAIADVRTQPWSRHAADYNSDTLKARLKAEGIAYVYLGKELGGRPERRLMCEGVADYEAMAREESFHSGLTRLVGGAQTYRVAMMCSEQHPLDCHRCLLVGRALLREDVDTQHILPDGAQITQTEVETQLLLMANKTQDDLFADADTLLAHAYAQRARKVAFSEAA